MHSTSAVAVKAVRFARALPGAGMGGELMSACTHNIQHFSAGHGFRDNVWLWRCTPTPLPLSVKARKTGPTAKIFRACMDSETPSTKRRPASSSRCDFILKSAAPRTDLCRAVGPSSRKLFLPEVCFGLTLLKSAFHSRYANLSRTRRSALRGVSLKPDTSAKCGQTRTIRPASNVGMDDAGLARKAHIAYGLAPGPLAGGCRRESRIPVRREM